MRRLPPPVLSPQDIEKFWRYTSKSDGCWLWTRARTGDGYGAMYVNGKQYRAHRISFMIHTGKYPNNLICHTCDNQQCVNPDHLFEGTHVDNIADMMAKGRARFSGVEIPPLPKSYMTVGRVRDIRNRWARYQATPLELAREYGISIQMVDDILEFRIWRDA